MIALLLFVGLVSHATCQDWQPFGDNEYYFATELASGYDGANSVCSEEGATLAIIHSEEENNFISKVLANNAGRLHE